MPNAQSPMLHVPDQLRRTAIEQNQVLVDLISWEDQIKAEDQRISKKDESIPSEGETSVTVGNCDTPNPNSNTSIEHSAEQLSEEGERKRGNQLYSKQMYKEASKAYTNAISINPKSVSAYSNRAMAFLKLKDWQRAEEDASTALTMDPLHVKSYERRSVARLNLGKHRAALRDLYMAQAAANKQGLALKIDFSKAEKALIETMHRAPKRTISIKVIPKVTTTTVTDKTLSSVPQSLEMSSNVSKNQNSSGRIEYLLKAKSWYSFEQAWISLSGEDQTKALSKLKPESILKMYRGGMENTEVLLSLIQAASKIPDHGPSVLHAISKIPSIDMLVMMMSKVERETLLKHISMITTNLDIDKTQEILLKFRLQ